MCLNDTFDSLSDFFGLQSTKPAYLSPINLRTLTPFQRALLVIDGSVTTFIEAYTMEPVEVIRISQETQSLPEKHVLLEAPKGTAVLVRQALLRGKYSHTLYVYAISLIVRDRLPDTMRQRLEVEGEGIGRLLFSSRVETYREVLWYGKEQIDHLPDALRHLADREFISRTYRIIAGGQPIILINERFPSGTARLPSHH